jgi:NADPH-dependent 2,4-dienoyl-CoA reductase/sulfur reductase-like enzyme
MDGQTLECGATLLASGAGPRRLGIAGEGVANVHVLRTAADANRLLDAAKTAKSVAIIGSGFVGMEAAASLRQRGLDVFVISSGQLPYVKQVGEQIGKLFRDVHERNGVLFHFNAKIEMLEIAEGKATAVSLNDGQRVAANLFLVAIGAEPQTGFLPRTILTKDGGVPVDANYAVIGANDVWAAGDIARPPDPRTGRPMRIEHWRTAMQQGRRAADQMLVSLGGGDDDAAEIASGLPYFWTFQFDLGLDYIGHADRWDEIKIEGDLPGANFIARYYEAGKLLAIASANRSQEVAALAEATEKEWK